MCGITGILYLDKEKEVTLDTLKKMTDSIHHRGPDDEGFYINQNVGLGFRRLSIIDLNTGHQPLANEDNTIWIIFNGEIYNYLELHENLLKQGHIFRTKSDTETIIHLYEQYGTNCLKYLRGMFSFCIWDTKKKQLFCARDRFGIKPFYYYLDTKKFVFGSEIKTILKANVDTTLSFDALDSYFAFDYISADLSIYKEIKKLQPAHFLLLTFTPKPLIKIDKYWEITFDPVYNRSEKEWCEEIDACLSETVKMHMIADVPLGAFLSGGIDSSSVVAMMSKNSAIPVKTFSIGFKEEKFNELKFAREIAKKYNCEHHEQIIEPESVELLPKLVNAYDEPFADSSAIPTYYVSKLAREFVTVALSGDGGDELFAGYNNYVQLKKYHSFPLNFSNSHANKFVWGNLYNMLPAGFKGKKSSYFLSKNKNYSGAYDCSWEKKERKKLLLKDFPIKYDSASELYKENLLKKSFNNDFITNLQYLDLKTYMVDDILTKVDRASMLNSLEVRVPLLDHKFAELSFKIPSNLKLKSKSQKYIFKKSMAPYLSDNILNHPKQGFAVPLSLWFKDDLQTYVKDTLGSDSCLLFSYLEKKHIQKVIADNKKRKNNLSRKIWSLLIFNEWLKQNQQFA